MFTSSQVAYRQTQAFSSLVSAYVENDPQLREFYLDLPNLDGIKNAIARKEKQSVDRDLLVNVLLQQYADVPVASQLTANLESLRHQTTFTVCTAHQPNLFTGPLYFIYKILHAIKLANYLSENLPAYNFVPLYYMGSEDADFAELNHTFINGQRIEWKRVQQGAVGRMLVDQTLLQLIDEIEGQLHSNPFGPELVDLLRKYYRVNTSIQQATFGLVNELYGEYGLIVLIPDHKDLKRTMIKVFHDDLTRHTPSRIVSQTSEKLAATFKAQAYPREINLFYLDNNLRERIEQNEDGDYSVVNTDLKFSKPQLLQLLEEDPRRFSPNVVLRGLYQETILPNVAFVGGGGELAYWLQLKDLFANYDVPFPILVLRNSFLIVQEKWKIKIAKSGFEVKDFFLQPVELLTRYAVENNPEFQELDPVIREVEKLYREVRSVANTSDPTLGMHVAALEKGAIEKLYALQKKILRAERRKHSSMDSQINSIKSQLFPNGSLQERRENFSNFFSLWGKQFIKAVLDNSPAFDQRFILLTEQ